MTAPAHRIVQCPDEMHILVFTVQSVIMGVDTLQIEEMLEVDEAAARGLRIRPIHEEISFGARPVTYKAPKVITIRGLTAEGNGEFRCSLAAMIDRPDHIADVTVDSIQCVPPPHRCPSQRLAGYLGGHRQERRRHPTPGFT
jgi:hypothetical protein